MTTIVNIKALVNTLASQLRGPKASNTRQWKRLFARLAPMGYMRVVFGSGEVLTRTRQAQLFEMIQRKLVNGVEYGFGQYGLDIESLELDRKKSQASLYINVPEDGSLKDYINLANGIVCGLEEMDVSWIESADQWERMILNFADRLKKERALVKANAKSVSKFGQLNHNDAMSFGYAA